MKLSSSEPVSLPIHMHILSNTPGRIRLRVAHEHRQPQAIAKISGILKAAFPGFHGVKTNGQTGSITIYYARKSENLEDTFATLRELGIIISNIPKKSEAATNITTAMTNLNQRVHRGTNGSVDLRILVPLAFSAIALRQLLSKGPGLKSAPWYVMAWYAFDSFIKLHYTNEPPPTDQPPKNE